MRKADDSLEKLAGKMKGQRLQGRSPTRYVDQIAAMTGATVHDCVQLAGNRNIEREGEQVEQL